MELNFTLIAQVLNFIITWLVLKKIVFSPALKSINKENNEKKSLIASIKQRQQSVVQKEDEKMYCVTQYQRYFHDQSPHIDEYSNLFFFKPIRRELSLEPFDKKKILQVTTELTQKVVHHLEQVHL